MRLPTHVPAPACAALAITLAACGDSSRPVDTSGALASASISSSAVLGSDTAIGSETALANGAIAPDLPSGSRASEVAAAVGREEPRRTSRPAADTRPPRDRGAKAPGSGVATQATPHLATRSADAVTERSPARSPDTIPDPTPQPTSTSPLPTASELTPPTRTRSTAPRRAEVPFAPGERLVYDVKFGSMDVGDAVMEVLGVEDVRGRDAYHTLFRVRGGTFFYKVNDRYESWIDVNSLVSLRHVQQIDEGSYERERNYEIFVERGVYRENDKPEQPTVAEPLDDGSFFFFVRTIPLEVGQTYEFHRYFRPDRNPVKITVVRREQIRVPAGTFEALVIRPTIKTKGVFGEGGQAEIWLAADSSRMMLQMKSKLKFGSLNLYLKNIKR